MIFVRKTTKLPIDYPNCDPRATRCRIESDKITNRYEKAMKEASKEGNAQKKELHNA